MNESVRGGKEGHTKKGKQVCEYVEESEGETVWGPRTSPFDVMQISHTGTRKNYRKRIKVITR